MQIIRPNFGIIVIATISERVNVGNACAAGVGGDGALAPRIVNVLGYNRAGIVGNCNNVALQVFIEIICSTVILDSANRAVKIVERNERVAIPRFLDNVRAVKRIFMLNAIYSFGNTNTFIVVLVRIAAKCFELSALFPSQSVTEVGGTVIVFLLYHF